MTLSPWAKEFVPAAKRDNTFVSTGWGKDGFGVRTGVQASHCVEPRSEPGVGSLELLDLPEEVGVT